MILCVSNEVKYFRYFSYLIFQSNFPFLESYGLFLSYHCALCVFSTVMLLRVSEGRKINCTSWIYCSTRSHSCLYFAGLSRPTDPQAMTHERNIKQTKRIVWGYLTKNMEKEMRLNIVCLWSLWFIFYSLQWLKWNENFDMDGIYPFQGKSSHTRAHSAVPSRN